MNELTVINHNGQFVVDSREVSEMIGKEHKNLLRGISPSDGWCGMSALRAKRIKDDDNVKTLAICLIAATSAIRE